VVRGDGRLVQLEIYFGEKKTLDSSIIYRKGVFDRLFDAWCTAVNVEPNLKRSGTACTEDAPTSDFTIVEIKRNPPNLKFHYIMFTPVIIVWSVVRC
jgi:hypothetical protein